MRVRRALVLLAVLAGLTGCVRLPDSGPVREDDTVGSQDQRVVCCYLPNPPQPGETPEDIVNHFLEAMTATPLQTTVAQKFLTKKAREGWHPEESTIVYDSKVVRGQRSISVTLDGAYRLDRRGAFAGRVPRELRTLVLPMDREDGEWRISALPNALIVPQGWADEQLSVVNAYYFDPSGRILVPQPVRLPQGDGFVTALLQSLVSGPGPGLGRVARSYVPPNLELGLSVPVSSGGVAEVAFEGDAGGLAPEQARLMAAQIAWTLKQDTEIRRIRLTADGRALPGLSSDISLEEGVQYDPAGFSATSDLVALRGGRVVTGQPGDMTPVEGRLGQRDFGLRSVATNLSGRRLAGVAGGGTSLLVSLAQPDTPVDQVVSEAGDLLRPAWDHANRIWLVDRGAGGARVSVVEAGRPRAVRAPALAGAVVTTFLVSRDGSRLVAVEHRPRRDRVVVLRIAYRDDGRVRRLRDPVTLPVTAAFGRPRIRAIAWRTPTSIAVLTPVRDLAQVRTYGVDGAPPSLNSAPSTLAGSFVGLAGAPDPTARLLATHRGAYLDLNAVERTQARADVDALTLGYAG